MSVTIHLSVGGLAACARHMAVLPRSTPPSDPLVAGVAFDGLENDLVDGGFVGEGSEEEEEVLTEHAGPGGSSSFEAVLLQLEQAPIRQPRQHVQFQSSPTSASMSLWLPGDDGASF